jgi:hypothetical protein
LFTGNFSLVGAVKQVVEQTRRKTFSTNARHNYLP